LLIGVALWLLNSQRGSRRALEQLVALFPIGVALISLLGYAYSAEGMYGLGELQRMALPTAASLLVLGIGILCARPDVGFVSAIVSNHAGGILARRMLPVAILVPAGLGWLTLSGQRAALFSEELGLAIAAAVTISAFVAFIAITARSLSQADRVREASERHLAAQNVTTSILVESRGRLPKPRLGHGSALERGFTDAHASLRRDTRGSTTAVAGNGRGQ
jgi:hypothetical protein